MEKADGIASSHWLSKFAENRINYQQLQPTSAQTSGCHLILFRPLQTSQASQASRACLLQASMACPNAQGTHLLRLLRAPGIVNK